MATQSGKSNDRPKLRKVMSDFRAQTLDQIMHGFDVQPQIDIPLLAKISEISKVPLVLHGGSGIPKEVIWECKKYGLIKINYGSDLRRVYIRTIGEAYEKNHGEYNVIRLSLEAVENVAATAQELVTMINEH